MISSFTKEKINPPDKNGKATMASASHLGGESAMSYTAMGRHNLGGGSRPGGTRATVTIAMSIKFGDKCVDIGPHYYKDLAKMAGLLMENASLIAILEACTAQNLSAIPVEITKLRLRNVMNYLVDNFGISRSRFYVDKLVMPVCFNESSKVLRESCGGVTVILKYPSLYS